MHASKATVPLAHLSPGYHPRRAAEYWPWEIGRGWVWGGGLVLALLVFFGIPAFLNWKHVVSSSGGHYFLHRTVIPVDAFQQNDPRWAEQLLGNTFETLGQAGCAVSSAAMIMHAYGVDTDPQRLNNYLTTHGGYVGDGLLVWEKAAEVGGGQVEKAYEDAPSYALLDANIRQGNPVIVRLHLHNGTTHFVVIVGKQGWDYLIRDPARPPDYGVYPLKNITGRIEALRYYKIVPPPPLLAVKPAPIPKPVAPVAVQPLPPPTVALGLSAVSKPPPFIPVKSALKTSAQMILAAPLSVQKTEAAPATNAQLQDYPPSTPITPPDHAP